MSLINWTKPKKARSAKDHNEKFSSDSGVDGTYVPNMSEEDQRSWKGKVTGKRSGYPVVEIRKAFTEANLLMFVSLGGGFKVNKHVGPHSTKDVNVRISTNGPISMTFDELDEFNRAVREATNILNEIKDTKS